MTETMSGIAIQDNFDSNLRIVSVGRFYPAEIGKMNWIEAVRPVFREREMNWPSPLRLSRIRLFERGAETRANLNSIYRRISRLTAEIRSTRSRNEGSRLAVNRERWTGAAPIIRRLHRNFAHRMPNEDRREFRRETPREHESIHSEYVCHSSWVNGEQAAGDEPRVFRKLSPNWRAELTVAAACAGNTEDRMVAVLFAGQFADCSTRSPLVHFLVTGLRVSRATGWFIARLIVCSHALIPRCAIQFSVDLKVLRERIT